MVIFMDFIIRDIEKPTEAELSQILSLWSEAFGDSEEFIRSFFEKMPLSSVFCAIDGEKIVSMAVLLDVAGAYYGYAVSTLKEYRGMGLCRKIHGYIRDKCEREKREYLIHPADLSLVSFYEKMGMKAVSSYYEASVAPSEGVKTREIDAFEYFYMRDLYFGGGHCALWGVDALSFMCTEGIAFISAYIDGVECAAAVDGDIILELCAPEDLFGRAASAFLPDGGKVRLFSAPNHLDPVGIMSFSGRELYFNLFLE